MLCATAWLAAPSRLQPAPGLLSRRLQRHRLIAASSGSSPPKGFGDVKPKKPADEGAGSSRGKVRRTTLRQPTGPFGRPQDDQLSGFSVKSPEQIQEELKMNEEEEAFNQRLAAIKSAADEAAKSAPLPSGTPSALESSPIDPYSSPPPLSRTLLGDPESNISDPKLKAARYGPGPAALAGGAVILGLVLVLTSGGGGGGGGSSSRFGNIRPAMSPPDQLEAGVLRDRASALQVPTSHSHLRVSNSARWAYIA